MNTYIKSGLTGLFLTLCAVNAPPALAMEEIDAYQVAVNADEREDGDTMTSALHMTLTNKRGQERKREVVTYRKDYGDDSKMVMFFKEPADVKNTGFLSWDYDDSEKDDDQWIYLPALKKVRRISSSGQSDYFMGTDFTYNDMGGNEVDDYTYQHLGNEDIDGVECYHIEAIPKDDEVVEETGYSRIERWIRPDIWVMVKSRFYDEKGRFLKELTTENIEQIDGIWTVKTMRMVNEQNNHQTLFTFSNIAYNTDIGDNVFSQRQLTRGVK